MTTGGAPGDKTNASVGALLPPWWGLQAVLCLRLVSSWQDSCFSGGSKKSCWYTGFQFSSYFKSENDNSQAVCILEQKPEVLSYFFNLLTFGDEYGFY